MTRLGLRALDSAVELSFWADPPWTMLSPSSGAWHISLSWCFGRGGAGLASAEGLWGVPVEQDETYVASVMDGFGEVPHIQCAYHMHCTAYPYSDDSLSRDRREKPANGKVTLFPLGLKHLVLQWLPDYRKTIAPLPDLTHRCVELSLYEWLILMSFLSLQATGIVPRPVGILSVQHCK